MPSITYSQSLSIGGVTISGSLTRTAEGQISALTTLPLAKAGTLSTRTSDAEGALTLSASHGITTGMTVNIYWTGGCRYGVTVGEVAGTSVPFSLGSGDNLPAEGSAVTAAQVVQIDLDFDGDLSVLLAASCTKAVHLDIQESDDSQIVGVDLAAAEPWVWAANGPLANPLAGKTVGKLAVANSSSAATAELRFGVLYDSVA